MTTDQTERQASRALPGVSFVVAIADGADAGRSFVVDPERPARLLLGKSPLCDIVLKDPMVSLTLHSGNVSRAAAASGLARRYFQKLRARQRR